MARSNGLSEAAADAVAAIDAVLNKVRRSIQRRDFGRLILARIDPSLEVSHLDVIIAIAHNPAVGDTPQDEVTVGNIAERLGIDPSRASRISADIVERGYALRVASQLDARRICLRLTARGERLVTAVRQTKWRIFAESLAQWDEQELVTFARLLERFAGWATDEASMRRSADAVKQMMDEAEPV
ncbi:MarR family transcriptional regulator [Mesorhizobium loti]|uniref:MarR family transcriptional regulator n=1 Tax=Rhizobium loti TaxID=381 RepID=A0A1A5HN49_RHILI|nr:MarR family transcriptional regulator [Mesorhizobium loti]OBP71420.1 MarR family transcriptional regulator [Mesorhizobium loti]OBP84472.1 MarR family transcriptional regulator [Mesorhizobium loti]OBP89534.1 MarR family transcriptional regulator [Mesorhizobium loti]OBP96520.1 MarR family transcriptional regulator [Mesorhizobium loti]